MYFLSEAFSPLLGHIVGTVEAAVLVVFCVELYSQLLGADVLSILEGTYVSWRTSNLRSKHN